MIAATRLILGGHRAPGIVDAMDPLTIGTVVVLLTLVAMLACVNPGRHAAEVDPLRALRVE